jgi:alkanesulfonate monooxygenase SsuD/methylene tetrahydromethanopterin reductase-like flavin-dependent oxidoreductase (luciferase family)
MRVQTPALSVEFAPKSRDRAKTECSRSEKSLFVTLVGTPARIADELIAWFENDAADGFMFTPRCPAA